MIREFVLKTVTGAMLRYSAETDTSDLPVPVLTQYLYKPTFANPSQKNLLFHVYIIQIAGIRFDQTMRFP